MVSSYIIFSVLVLSLQQQSFFTDVDTLRLKVPGFWVSHHETKWRAEKQASARAAAAKAARMAAAASDRAGEAVMEADEAVKVVKARLAAAEAAKVAGAAAESASVVATKANDILFLASAASAAAADDEPPKDLCCSITGELFVDPVLTVDGHTYERSAIQQWFRMGKNRSPVTNDELPNTSVFQNIRLRNVVEEYRRKNGIPIPETESTNDASTIDDIEHMFIAYSDRPYLQIFWKSGSLSSLNSYKWYLHSSGSDWRRSQLKGQCIQTGEWRVNITMGDIEASLKQRGREISCYLGPIEFFRELGNCSGKLLIKDNLRPRGVLPGPSLKFIHPLSICHID